jgi:hypothetical protein
MEKLVIGLMGVKESGKSTVAEILAEDFDFAILEPGMQVMELLLDIDPYITAGGPYYSRVSTIYAEEGYLGFKRRPEGRRLLQELGTRIRHRDPYFWVNLQLQAIQNTDGNIVSTAVRFPNEARMIRGYEGQIWLVSNPKVEDTQDHESEAAWRTLRWDHEIVNDETLSDLRDTVSRAIKELR